MKAIKNTDEFLSSLYDAIYSGMPTYIFGSTMGIKENFDFEEEYDFYLDDDEDIVQYGNYFHITPNFDFVKLQKNIFETMVGDNDEPVDIVLDYIKWDGRDEDHYYMVTRLRIVWKDEDDNDED